MNQKALKVFQILNLAFLVFFLTGIWTNEARAHVAHHVAEKQTTAVQHIAVVDEQQFLQKFDSDPVSVPHPQSGSTTCPPSVCMTAITVANFISPFIHVRVKIAPVMKQTPPYGAAAIDFYHPPRS